MSSIRKHATTHPDAKHPLLLACSHHGGDERSCAGPRCAGPRRPHPRRRSGPPMTTQHAETGTIDVPTRSGTVRGVRRDHDAVFLGIPFAEPPTGPRRFAAPAPHRPWDGARPATAFGATPQRRPFGEMVGIPERSIPGDSTLNVNVFTPAAGDREAK